MRTNRSSTDLPALQDSFVYSLIDMANREYLRAFRRGSGSEPLTSSADTGFSLVTDTTLNAAVATTDVTITLTDTTNASSTGGCAVIWENSMTPDVIFYTGKSATQLTGVTGIGFAHSTSTPIQFLYKLPTDFATFRPAELYGDGVQLNGIPMRFREGPPYFGYFSMVDNGDAGRFLWLSRGSSGKCSVLYEKNATTITQSTDIPDCPVDFEWFLVWKAVQYICLPEGDSGELYMIATNEASRILKDALALKDIGKYARARQFPRLRRRQYDPALFLSLPRG
jgi:hypothetical protein